MNAIPIKNQDTPLDKDKQLLSDMIDLMGKVDGGFTDEEFQGIKQTMLDSGIGTEQLMQLLSENLFGTLTQRPPIDVTIQRLTEDAVIPTYSHPSDACADITSNETHTFAPGETYALSTGLAVAFESGYQINIYARSGLSLRTPMRLANSVGIIDSEYRDEIKVPMWNSSDSEFITINKGDRIAQMGIVVSPYAMFHEVDDIHSIEGDRNGGFGSTGV